MATKRLKKEFDGLTTFGHDSCVDVHLIKDNLFSWEVTLAGPSNSPYNHGRFSVHLNFSPDFPFSCPKVSFKTSIYHPSINKETGQLCQQALQDDWKPNRSVGWILDVVTDMLRNPSPRNPVETDIASEIETNPKIFERHAKEWTKLYAK